MVVQMVTNVRVEDSIRLWSRAIAQGSSTSGEGTLDGPLWPGGPETRLGRRLQIRRSQVLFASSARPSISCAALSPTAARCRLP